MTIEEYKGYTIEHDWNNPYSSEPQFMFYPTEEGLSHDMDWEGEGWIYCGNALWADSLEEAKILIDEL